MACNCLCCTTLGACCTEGVCDVKTCSACEAGGGVWQGPDTTCEDGNCGDLCCFPFGDCNYRGCESGYFASRCEAIGGTVPESCGFTHPGVGNAQCEDGGPSSWTVTVTGAQPMDPSDPDDVALAGACNSSFVVERSGPCAVNGTYTDPDYPITVSVAMFLVGILAGRVNAGITAGGSHCANGQGGALSVVDTDCAGRNIYDCTTFALGAGNTGYTNSGRVDFSSATVALS